MASILPNSFVYLREINPALDRYKIKICVVRLWRAFKSIEMVLVDGEGTRVHASIEEGLVKRFQHQFISGEARIIDTFDFVDYDGDYRTSPLGFKIVFYRTTTVKPCDDFPSQVTEKYLKEFAEILSGKLDRQILFDVLGQIVDVGSLDNVKAKGKDTVKLTFEIQDLGGQRLACTIWGDLATNFSSYFKNNEEPVILCVIRLACIKEWKGTISISNAFNSTDMLFNPSIPEVHKFRQKLLAGSDDLIHVDSEGKPNQPAVTLYEEFFLLNEKKSVDDIVYACDVTTCVTIAKICYIEVMPKWYYIACKVCGKKVQPYPHGSHDDDGPIYSCGVCDADVIDVSYRYKLILRASYGASHVVKLLFFDGLAQRLIGKTAAELFAEVPESDPSILPELLADLMGKTMLFKISIGADNLKSMKAAYVVEKFWEKKDMVEQFAKELSVVSDSACDISKANSEVVEHSVVDVGPPSAKRSADDVKPGPAAVPKMVTRKKPKIEKLT